MNLTSYTLAGIVTFNPEIGRLQENIEAVLRNGIPHVIIIDNSSDNLSEINTLLETCSKVSIIENQKNEGIAYALNQIFREAADAKKYDWVLTLDQDSVIDDSLMISYEAIPLEESVVSLTSLRRDRNHSQTQKHSDAPFEYVDRCITSGNLLKISAWELVGGFDNKLFIDEVDYDFCYRLRELGYQIIRVNKQLLLQESGKATTVRFLGKDRIVYHHSAQRKYYHVRNEVYLLRTCPFCRKYDSYALVFRFFAKTVLFEKENRKEKIHMMVKGFLDGIKMSRENPKKESQVL